MNGRQWSSGKGIHSAEQRRGERALLQHYQICYKKPRQIVQRRAEVRTMWVAAIDETRAVHPQGEQGREQGSGELHARRPARASPILIH